MSRKPAPPFIFTGTHTQEFCLKQGMHVHRPDADADFGEVCMGGESECYLWNNQLHNFLMELGSDQ